MKEDFIELLKEHSDLAAHTGFYIGSDIPEKKLSNALRTFASGTEDSEVLGIYDTTVFGSTKEGIVFTRHEITQIL